MSMTSQSGLTGLQQLRELAASVRKIAIGETLGFRLAEVEEGLAVFESKPGRQQRLACHSKERRHSI
jgi:hypothetical protein